MENEIIYHAKLIYHLKTVYAFIIYNRMYSMYYTPHVDEKIYFIYNGNVRVKIDSMNIDDILINGEYSNVYHHTQDDFFEYKDELVFRQADMIFNRNINMKIILED